MEGTPDDPDPNKPFAKMENNPLFNNAGMISIFLEFNKISRIGIQYKRAVSLRGSNL